MRRILNGTFDSGYHRGVRMPDRWNDFVRRPAAAERLVEGHEAVAGKPDDLGTLLLQRELLPFGVENVEEIGQAPVVALGRHLGRLTRRIEGEIEAALLAQLAGRGCDGIAAPSANRFGRISATTAKHVADEFGDAIALILDGGPSRHGIESTIVDFTGGDPVLLRPGSITSEALARVLGAAPRSAGQGETRAPGTLASHYAPRTKALLLPRSELLAALAGLGGPGSHISVLAHSVAQPPEFEGAWFDAPGESARYAQQLYANLRALDAREADEIWIEAPPDGPDWVAIGDRLRRATHRD